MWCIRELKVYFVIFYLFGQSSYIPLKTDHVKGLRIASYIPKIIHLTVPISHFILNAYNQKLKLTSFHVIATQYSMFLVFLSNYYPLFLSVLYPNTSFQLCEYFGNIFQYLEHNLHINIQIGKFKKNFTQLLFLKMAFSTVAFASRFAETSVFLHPMENILFTVSVFIGIFAAFHVILFISLVHFILRTINKVFKNIWRGPKRPNDAFEFLRHLKWTHYKLWKISRALDNQFGLVILLLLLHNGLVMGFTIYRTFVIWPSSLITSKYRFLHFCFSSSFNS